MALENVAVESRKLGLGHTHDSLSHLRLIPVIIQNIYFVHHYSLRVSYLIQPLTKHWPGIWKNQIRKTRNYERLSVDKQQVSSDACSCSQVFNRGNLRLKLAFWPLCI